MSKTKIEIEIEYNKDGHSTKVNSSQLTEMDCIMGIGVLQSELKGKLKKYEEIKEALREFTNLK